MTAHDLAADWSWQDEASGFRLRTGRRIWEVAAYGSGLLVRIQRLEPRADGTIRIHTRYIDPDTRVELVL